MAMPLGKTRLLPDWMIGAGDRAGLGNPKPAKSKVSTVNNVIKPAGTKELPPKATPKAKRERSDLKYSKFHLIKEFHLYNSYTSISISCIYHLFHLPTCHVCTCLMYQCQRVTYILSHMPLPTCHVSTCVIWPHAKARMYLFK